jgi:plastocyanin
MDMRNLIIVVLVLTLTAACGDDDATTSSTDAPADRTPISSASSSDSTDDTTAGGDCQDDTKVDGPADLEMQDFTFAPPCLVISTSQGLRLHNEGENEHNFSVEGVSGLDVDVSAGDENNTEATGLEPGRYTFFCKYHRASNDMEGKLRVENA